VVRADPGQTGLTESEDRPFSVSGKATPTSRVRSGVAVGLGVVEESRHVSKQCAREPGDIQSVCASRPVREGERPMTRLMGQTEQPPL
jgi:hypothetical protein